ncbi:MAG: diguanylate cyclase domain-containing protein [Pleurocapsa sp.]
MSNNARFLTQQSEPASQGDILVVDDKPENLLLLSVALTKKGYEVRKVVNGNLALLAAQAEPPDLVLLDINMPEMNGYQVCRQLKANSKTQDIPIIFITASDEAFDKVKAFNLGGSDYITKPFQIEEVRVRIENQLAICRLQQKLKAQNAKLEKEVRYRQAIETELLEANRRLKILANLDGLTQVANRHRFDEYFAREWLRSQREKTELAIILCDVDYFKPYNDHFGHQAGDVCLQKVAQTLSRVIKRPADLVARYGGEEFAIILPQTPATTALEIAETIRQQIAQLNLEHPASTVSDRVSLSLGVTSLQPSLQYTKEQLLATADRALYQAKQQGRNCAVLQLIINNN